MANAGNKPSNPGLKRGIFGTVRSLDLRAHRCIISLRDHGKYIGSGILDTEKLEARLEGVSCFDSFIGGSRPLIATIIPLTAERAQELSWRDGQWEVLGVRQRGSKPEPLKIPGTFKTSGQKPRSYAPSMAYCKQALSLSPGVRSGPPKELIAKVLHYFRKLVGNGALPNTRVLQHELKALLTKQRKIATSDRTPEILVIEDVESCKREVARLQRRAREGRQLILAIDCEGVNLGKEGPLTLIQIGTEEGEVFVFDVLATPDPKDMFIGGGLKVLLENPNIRKVIHDCRSDQCALYFQFGVTLTNVFDTSAAYTTIWDQCNIFAGPYRPKLALLLEIFRLTAEQKTEAFAELVHDKQLFGQRPLTKEMIKYASDDVLCLLPVIYESLDKLISPLWRPHFEQKVEQYLEESRIRDPHAMYEENQG
ncbi:putative exosome component 10-like [Apostichopus japonicus]|uniref:Putative exosome component 10-like n=1 Tax=Stichopus japonicus TaxID=307972 RepID=A0A2G8KXH6_STIJA|nr:putative exosome component 10-like [Apostichopus japonicus]